MKNKFLVQLPALLLASVFLPTIFSSCEIPPSARAASASVDLKAAAPAAIATAGPVTIPASPVILSRPQVPILCYHQIRDWRPGDSKQAKDYIVPVANFSEQIKMLADSGYHTISADQLYGYLISGAALPAKPLMLTFDDTDLPQYTIAKPILEKYGFKGVFFIMTVSLGRPNYMSRDQVKELSASGHEIGSHTWDHKNIKKFESADWAKQIDKPTETLERITGKQIKYFAYPFGLWNESAIPHLREHGFVAAFQLSEKRSEGEPLYSIRRMIVPGAWSASGLLSRMKHTF